MVKIESEVEDQELKGQEPKEIDAIDDSMIKVIFTMSKKTWKRLGEIALDRETSRSSLVREAISQYIKTLETPQEQNPKIPDRQLDKILENCTKEDGGFEIDGEGFIAQFSAKGWKLSDLTPEQWKKVSEKLQIGYDGYWSKPEPEEFAEKFSELEPNEEQLAWLSGDTEEAITESKT
jgi:DNA-binding TFAR19-related protein (PDSD5 family)